MVQCFEETTVARTLTPERPLSEREETAPGCGDYQVFRALTLEFSNAPAKEKTVIPGF